MQFMIIHNSILSMKKTVLFKESDFCFAYLFAVIARANVPNVGTSINDDQY